MAPKPPRMDLIPRLQEEKKDRERVAIEQTLKSNFSKTGKIVDVTPAGVVIEGDVELKHTFSGKKLPVKFASVSGTFVVSDTSLETLESAPEKALKIDISNTKVRSLKGIPDTTLGIHASGLELENLRGIPGNTKNLLLDNTVIKSLEGAPDEVHGKMRFDAANLKSLEHLPKKIGDLTIYNLPKNFPIMRLFISDISKVVFSGEKGFKSSEDGVKFERIVNSNLGKGRVGAIEAQKQLHDAGFGEYAKV